MRVWNMVNVPRRRIRGTRDYAKRTRAEGYTNRDIGADAARALKKIALGPVTDPSKYIAGFAGMPKNFRQSCLAPLDADNRFTASSVLSGVADSTIGDVTISNRRSAIQDGGEGKRREDATSASFADASRGGAGATSHTRGREPHTRRPRTRGGTRAPARDRC